MGSLFTKPKEPRAVDTSSAISTGYNYYLHQLFVAVSDSIFPTSVCEVIRDYIAIASRERFFELILLTDGLNANLNEIGQIFVHVQIWRTETWSDASKFIGISFVIRSMDERSSKFGASLPLWSPPNPMILEGLIYALNMNQFSTYLYGILQYATWDHRIGENCIKIRKIFSSKAIYRECDLVCEYLIDSYVQSIKKLLCLGEPDDALSSGTIQKKKCD
jgi:hypothetical protein